LPTIFRYKGYRFFFYSSEGDPLEPLHIHIERDDKIAKFWLNPTRLQFSIGFNRVEISRIEKIINKHNLNLVKAWNEYFAD